VNHLFNFHTIYTKLDPKSKTLIVTLNKAQNQNLINLEMLFELETCLSWAYSKVEIKSILINSSSEIFSQGLSKASIKAMDAKKIKTIQDRVLQVQKLILSSPQTVVFDLGKGASNVALELSFAADICISQFDAEFYLDNLELGIPLMHFSRISTQKWGSQFLRNCLFVQKNCVNFLRENGVLLDCYFDQSTSLINEILQKVNLQSSFTKTQSKAMLNYPILRSIDADFEQERKFHNATLSIQDWKKDIYNTPTKAKSQIKLTLVK